MVICEMSSRTYLIPRNMSIGRIGRRAERKLLLPSWAPLRGSVSATNRFAQHLRDFGAFIYHGLRSRIAVVSCAGHHADSHGADRVRGAWLGIQIGRASCRG